MFSIINYQGRNTYQNHNEVSLYPLGWLESKGQIVSIDKDVEKFEPSYFAGRMQMVQQLGRKSA